MPTWNPNTITNPFFSLTLEPAHGGRIVSLRTALGELTVEPAASQLSRAKIPARFGLLAVQLWQESYWHNDLCHREWPITNTNVTPGRVSVSLTAQSAVWPGVQVGREVIVTDDPWIDVDHGLNPGSTSGHYMPPAFCFSNVMCERGRTFVPSSVGVLALPRWPQDQSWCHEPTHGWMAWVGHTQGLAFVTDAAHLRHVRIAHHSSDRVEWIRRRVPTYERTVVRMIPFAGLSRVDGVGEAGIVALERTPRGLEIHLYALRTGTADVVLQVVRARSETEEIYRINAALTAGTVRRVLVPEPSGGTAWRGQLLIDYGSGSLTTEFTAPPASGQQHREGRLRGDLPPVARVAELPRADHAHRAPPRSFAFDAAPAPLPAPWLEADRTSRLRVLALVPTVGAASIIALAHHFDLDLTLPYVPRSAAIPTGPNGIDGQRFRLELGDRYEGFTGAELIARWNEALDPAIQYDAILLGIGRDDGWALLPQTLQAEILNRVQAGTGLVSIRRGNPRGPNPETATLTGLLPLALRGLSDYSGPWYPSTDRTVQGLPWNVMPGSGRILEYSVIPGAQTLLEITLTSRRRLPFLARTNYGTGRILDVAWGPCPLPIDRYRTRPAGTDRMDTFRYDLALLARVLYDAAARQPPINVMNVVLTANTATVELDAPAAAPPFVLDWVARDRFGVALGSGRETHTSLPSGGSVTFAVPGGAWTVDVRVLPNAGDPAWGAGGRILDFGITVSPDLSVMNQNDQVTITPSAVTGTSQYVVDTVDGRGRVVARTNVPAGGTTAVSAALLETPHAELRVHALDVQGELLAQAARRFRVRRRSGFDGWPIHFWSYLATLPNQLLVRQLDAHASLGVWTLFSLGESSLQSHTAVAADHLDIPYCVETSNWTAVSGGIAPNGAGDPFTLTNAARIAEGRAEDTRRAADLADGNILFYKVGHESVAPRTNVSHDPETLAQFRSWLAARYNHSDLLLQAEWGPAAGLAGATPLSFADAVAAFATGLTYAAWVDHRRFIMDLFNLVPGLSREALLRGDPHARTVNNGETSMSMARGRDWWVRGQTLDVVGRYATGIGFEVAAVGGRSVGWTGYDDPDPVVRYRFWNAFGLAESGQALFNEVTHVNPDLSLPEVGRDLAAALLPARRGIGGLFMASEPAADDIYVLTSPDSSCVLAIHGYESLGAWVPGTGTPPARVDLGLHAREGVHELLAAMGVGWRAISPADIETGALERGRARLLILPMCIALSDAACEAIQRWVQRGGRIIADLLPGVFTAHGRLRGTGISSTGAIQGSTNPLDAVFGVSPGARPPVTTNLSVPVTIGGTPGFPVRCADTVLIASSTPSSGGTAGLTAPVWFLNAFNQGQAAYLGCSLFADYFISPSTATSAADRARIVADRRRMETVFSGLLQTMGVPARVTATDSTGQRANLCQFRVRAIGAIELVVLLRNYLGIYDPVEPEAGAELEFLNAAHTYDVETGTYLGYGRHLPIHISAYTQRAFARLPYQVNGIDLRFHNQAQRGDRIVMTAALNVTDGFASGHYLRLDVLDQHGTPIRYLAREASAESGNATFTIPAAFNDPAGVWTIRVTDVATGVEAQAQIDMGPRRSAVPQPEPLHIDAIDD